MGVVTSGCDEAAAAADVSTMVVVREREMGSAKTRARDKRQSATEARVRSMSALRSSSKEKNGRQEHTISGIPGL